MYISYVITDPSPQIHHTFCRGPDFLFGHRNMLRGASRLVGRTKQLSRRCVSRTAIRKGGDAGGPMMPPFARLAPPTETVNIASSHGP